MAKTLKTPNDKIKRILEGRRETQTFAAFQMGIERGRFCSIANGILIPGPETKAKIASYLETPEAELF